MCIFLFCCSTWEGVCIKWWISMFISPARQLVSPLIWPCSMDTTVTHSHTRRAYFLYGLNFTVNCMALAVYGMVDSPRRFGTGVGWSTNENNMFSSCWGCFKLAMLANCWDKHRHNMNAIFGCINTCSWNHTTKEIVGVWKFLYWIHSKFYQSLVKSPSLSDQTEQYLCLFFK